MQHLAKRSEAHFQRQVATDLKTLPRTYFFKVQQVSRVGDPDYVCVINSHPVFIELKKDFGSKPRLRQLLALHKAQAAGAFCFVAYPTNWDKVFSFLRHLATQPIELQEIEDPCLKLPSLT